MAFWYLFAELEGEERVVPDVTKVIAVVRMHPAQIRCLVAFLNCPTQASVTASLRIPFLSLKTFPWRKRIIGAKRKYAYEIASSPISRGG